MIEELEVLWLKFEAQRGYQFQKYGDQDDHIFILYKGTARQLVPSSEFEKEKEFSDDQRQIVFGNLSVGDFFGEQSAINDLPNPWTIEVTSKSATIFKIHRSQFIQHFGGQEGAPAKTLRSWIQMKHNWDRMKWEHIQSMTSDEQFSRLQFRDETIYKRLNKTAACNFIKEAPFKGAEQQQVSGREKMIAEMKAKFAAPIVPKRKTSSDQVDAPQSSEDLDSKYDKNMAWGTPRLVGKGAKDGIRSLTMSQQSVAQRQNLLKIAKSRTVGEPTPVTAKQGEFSTENLKDFREKMIQSEKEEMG